MFPGSSCYPMSPFNNESGIMDEKDQIFTILKKLPGLDKDLDFCFLSDSKLDEYIIKIHEAATNNFNA